MKRQLIHRDILCSHSEDTPLSFAPVSLRLNLSQLQRDTGVLFGLPDVTSITLSDSQGRAVAWQFTPDTLPLLKPTVSMGLAAGLRPRISTDEALPDIAGMLTFHRVKGCAAYRLAFETVGEAEAVQDYTPPRRLVIVKEDGRFDAMPFAHMTVQPISPRDGMVSVFEDGELRASYHTRDTRRPYCYPLIGPHKVNVLSLGKPGESEGGHTHHMGLWIANRDVNGVNFWEDYGEGTIEHRRFTKLVSGPLFAVVESENEWKHGETIIARETREMTFYRAQEGTMAIDIAFTLSPTETALRLNQNTFGFLAIRMAETMAPYAGGWYVTANGDINEDNAFWKHARWIAQVGRDTADTHCCCILMDHPDNPSFPTAWHMRNDGFITAATARAGDVTAAADGRLAFRHRVLLTPADGHDMASLAERLWRQYTAPPSLKY